jgi:hypothetical protein
MSHFVNIGGTAYEVIGGRTLVDGTEREILLGKTLIDGTEYDIPFTKTITLSSNTYNDNRVGFIAIDGVKYTDEDCRDSDLVLKVKHGSEVLVYVYDGTYVTVSAIYHNGVAVDKEVGNMLVSHGEYTFNLTKDTKIRFNYTKTEASSSSENDKRYIRIYITDV